MATGATSQDDAETLIAEAAAARRQGRNDAATALYQRAVALMPDHPVALNALGMRALRNRDFGGARDWFAKAAAADPGASGLWLNLAAAARGLGDNDGERQALSSALDADQSDLMALLRLAELHERMGETAAASRRWSDVLAATTALPERPPALDAVIAHAAAFVAARTAETIAAIDDAVAAVARKTVPGSRRRVDAARDALLGRRRIYANVCSGLHVPFLPADEFFDAAAFPWLREIASATADIRAELTTLINAGQAFAPYVELPPGTPPNTWSELDGSPDWSALHLWRHGERQDDVCARCPRTAAALAALPLAQIPGRMPTAFFSLLRPRAHIPPHTGVSNIRAIVHLPLIVPPGCRFRVGGETRSWREGEPLVFDDTIEHEAWNDGDALRAVLIFDVWNPHLTPDERTLFGAFFTAADCDPNAPDRIAISD